jgi:hypothetical protein
LFVDGPSVSLPFKGLAVLCCMVVLSGCVTIPDIPLEPLTNAPLAKNVAIRPQPLSVSKGGRAIANFEIHNGEDFSMCIEQDTVSARGYNFDFSFQLRDRSRNPVRWRAAGFLPPPSGIDVVVQAGGKLNFSRELAGLLEAKYSPDFLKQHQPLEVRSLLRFRACDTKQTYWASSDWQTVRFEARD